MSGTIIAVLSDPKISDIVSAVGNRLGLGVLLSVPSQKLVEEIPLDESARLLVLELDAPGIGGPSACRRVRSTSDIPILALADRSDTLWIVETLRGGADCYLPKTVESELLAAHLEAILRRQAPTYSGPPSVAVRDLTVDFIRKEVRFRNELVPVTPAEYRLLAYLATQLGRVVPSAELIREMSGYDCSEQEAQEIVKVHVSRLRAKIDRDAAEPSYLLNVRGFGYLLERRSSTNARRDGSAQENLCS